MLVMLVLAFIQLIHPPVEMKSLEEIPATILIIGSPLKLYASHAGVGFYSTNSPPVEMKSLEPLIGKWWDFWVDHPVSYHETWPVCLKGDGGTVGKNQSVVFLDPQCVRKKC